MPDVHQVYITSNSYYFGHKRLPNDLPLETTGNGSLESPFVPVQGGGSSYLVSTVTLTDTQIKALPTTPIEIVAAQGAGKLISVINTVLSWNVSAGAYTNTDGDTRFYVQYDAGGGQASSLSAIPLATTNQVSQIPAYSTDGTVGWEGNTTSGLDNTSDVSNKKVEAYIDNAGGDLTGGNASNTLKITVYYVVSDL